MRGQAKQASEREGQRVSESERQGKARERDVTRDPGRSASGAAAQAASMLRSKSCFSASHRYGYGTWSRWLVTLVRAVTAVKKGGQKSLEGLLAVSRVESRGRRAGVEVLNIYIYIYIRW